MKGRNEKADIVFDIINKANELNITISTKDLFIKKFINKYYVIK